MNINNKTTPPLLESGFSLLEVLIALLILSVGLLGFARAEILAIRYNQAAYWQSLAQSQINSLTEQLRACGTNNFICLSQEISVWQNESKNLLPESQSKIDADQANYKITLEWRSLPFGDRTTLSHITTQVQL